MYGALLCQDTELTRSGEADMGVLFMHNEGFSTMCGHATIALGRFLVDQQHNKSILPAGRRLEYNDESATVSVRLHTPCGIVPIKVPVSPDGKVDQTRATSFVSVPSFATGLRVKIEIDPEFRWPELGERTYVTADFSYGGAFYCMVSPEEIGFPFGLGKPDSSRMGFAKTMLNAAANAQPNVRKYFRHPQSSELGFLYSIMLVGPDPNATTSSKRSEAFNEDVRGSEVGLCYFANQQIDRSPTGGAVAARMALAYAKGVRQTGDRWRYQSLLSSAYNGTGSFVGTILDEIPNSDNAKFPQVKIQVEGIAYYTGHYSFVAEQDDEIGRDGFSLPEVGL